MNSQEMVSFLKAIQTWLQICERQGKPVDPDQFYTLALHSSLLRRLMAGKPALPHPPPVYFSQPYYELIESGFGVVNMFLFKNPSTGEIVPIVGQNMGWKLEQMNEDGSLVISYPNYGTWDAVLKDKTPLEEMWSIKRRGASTSESEEVQG